MIDAADHSLDLQYFIWQNDASGILVIQHVLEAADRGVRGRALMDDVQLEGMVDRLNALDAHPNVELRIFNPFSVRLSRRLGWCRAGEVARRSMASLASFALLRASDRETAGYFPN